MKTIPAIPDEAFADVQGYELSAIREALHNQTLTVNLVKSDYFRPDSRRYAIVVQSEGDRPIYIGWVIGNGRTWDGFRRYGGRGINCAVLGATRRETIVDIIWEATR